MQSEKVLFPNDGDARFTDVPGLDAQFPVIYQTMKAEVQNLLDKMDLRQIEQVLYQILTSKGLILVLKCQVIEVARQIRNPIQAEQEASDGKIGEFIAPEEPTTYSSNFQEANQLVTELGAKYLKMLSLGKM